jgi:hypothetical protein
MYCRIATEEAFATTALVGGVQAPTEGRWVISAGPLIRQLRLPACRHGHTSASLPDPDRPKNAYVREEIALAQLPALHSMLASAGARRGAPAHGASPSGLLGQSPAEIIGGGAHLIEKMLAYLVRSPDQR